MLQCLLLGILSGKIEEKDIPNIKNTLINMDTVLISQQLIHKLNYKSHQNTSTALKMYNISWFLANNKNAPQFTIKDKIFLANKLRKFDSFFPLLFGREENIFTQNERAELILKINYDPGFAMEKELIADQIGFFLKYGQIEKALLYVTVCTIISYTTNYSIYIYIYRCCELINDQMQAVEILKYNKEHLIQLSNKLLPNEEYRENILQEKTNLIIEHLTQHKLETNASSELIFVHNSYINIIDKRFKSKELGFKYKF